MRTDSRSPHAAALCAAVLLAVVASMVLAPPCRSAPGQPVETWYDEFLDGDKTGYRRVVWSPSTWEGRETIHDTTTVFSRTQRNMAGHRDAFSSTSTSDLERGVDGTLWWFRTRVEEGGRVLVEETRWTGKGYVHTSGIEGQVPKKIEIALDAPVCVDAESFLGERIRAGTLKAGDRHKLRTLNVRARSAHENDIVVLGPETVEDEHGKDIECTKVAQRDPESGSEVLLWLDARGTFVRVRMGGFLIRRTTQAKAEKMPVRAAEYRITVPGDPWLERVFNADRLEVDVHVRKDVHRKLPALPDSPWSRVLATEGSDQAGWTLRVELRSHGKASPAGSDAKPEARVGATRPVTDPKFGRYLEASALMQVGHPLVERTAAEQVGDEKDVRKAAFALARFVFRTLDKRSPNVSQSDAVQILADCEGDCSEHALVFVALCRAAGIPARRCSGYVCIGGTWGSHAWAEIWTGRWIGADPTTGEVGTAARYLFFGYPDEPGSFPAVVSGAASGRLRIVTTKLQEGAATFDLTRESRHRIRDRAAGRYLHVLAGLEAQDVPTTWRVDLLGDRTMRIRGPGFSAHLIAQADQGQAPDSIGEHFAGAMTTFAGAPALDIGSGSSKRMLVFSRRRLVQVIVVGGSEETLEQLEKVVAPTFRDTVEPWPEEKKR